MHNNWRQTGITVVNTTNSHRTITRNTARQNTGRTSKSEGETLMKKQITKHFMAFFLSLVMIMAMGLTAFADETETYTLTVNNTGTTEHIFELYQIFTGDLSDDGTLSNIQWGAGVTDAGKKQFEDASTKAASLNENNAKDFANSLAQFLTSPTTSTGVSANSSYKFDDLTAGYYLVKDKDGTQINGGSYTSFIMKVTGNETVSTKLGVPTVEKKLRISMTVPTVKRNNGMIPLTMILVTWYLIKLRVLCRPTLIAIRPTSMSSPIR